jgi:hypothetical protein
MELKIRFPGFIKCLYHAQVGFDTGLLNILANHLKKLRKKRLLWFATKVFQSR